MAGPYSHGEAKCAFLRSTIEGVCAYAHERVDAPTEAAVGRVSRPSKHPVQTISLVGPAPARGGGQVSFEGGNFPTLFHLIFLPHRSKTIAKPDTFTISHTFFHVFHPFI